MTNAAPGPRPPHRRPHPDQLRPVTINRGWTEHAEGSVLVAFGDTKVLCTAVVHRGRPALAQGQRARAGSPPSTPCCRAPPTPAATASPSAARSAAAPTRSPASSAARCARVIDHKALGENTIVLDCDVLQADGGTRTAAITGAYVALADAIAWAKGEKLVKAGREPLTGTVAAVSASASSAACRCSTSATRRTSAPRPT